jgi:hypothetical protein
MRAALAMRPEGGVRRNAARSGSPKRESDDITAASGDEGARADVDVALSLARNAVAPFVCRGGSGPSVRHRSRWYTPCHTMPTKLPRIAVVRDAALDQALASVRELIGSDRPAAAQVHDLAVKGAEALIADAEHRRRLRLELNDMAASEDPPWDREVLRDIDRLGWGHT